ncbi:chemotaxis protein CheW [Reyranella sp.]|uniref:chemotaxis protein CheW n=1 Tax=Reyranella sp. TaxID=1929291 RepID=UPI00272F655F|nr:chemotaxis protein CheW [Reyranella sp.]MDP2372796.1 chemotaxis protein CheW [Reyranella sp.]
MTIVINVFELSSYRYAIPMADTREIFCVPSIVPLPKAPLFIEGIVNIRGAVIPVLDVRKRFRLPEKAPQPADHLVVAQAGPRMVALRVDRVLGTEEVDPKHIEDAAAITPRLEYVAGVAKLPDGLVLIHDLRTFLAESEARQLDRALDEVLPQ